ncbi:MAG: DUF4149 domain-containing protein [Vampirovibrionales bacterium]|nr:DUF4149 domain-containing protein [Vampirovibrionales bacterium]
MTLPSSPSSMLLVVGSRLSVVALSLFVGGIITLGANVAPLLFKTLQRGDASQVMTLIFRRFDTWMLFGLMAFLLGEGFKLWSLGWPTELLGWLRLGIMAAFSGLILLSVLLVHPKLEAQQALLSAAQSVSPQWPVIASTFHAIHKQAEQLLRLAWVLALTLLIWR